MSILNDPLLDAKQVAARLSISLRLAQELIPEMQPINVSSGSKRKLWRVRTSELEAWQQRRTQLPDYSRPQIVPQRRKPPHTRRPAGWAPGQKIPYRK